MTDTFTLDVAQATEIKHAAIRAGATNADLKTLSSGDMLAKILPVLRGRAEIVIKSIFELVTVVKLPALPRFVASEKFVVSKNDSAEVKIALIWEGFEPFLGKVEEPTEESELRVSRLINDSPDARILAELDSKARIKLAQFYALLSRQGHGQKEGKLLVDGRVNIFYIEGEDALVVRAYWLPEQGGWCLYTDSVQGSGKWAYGYQVVSLN